MVREINTPTPRLGCYLDSLEFILSRQESGEVFPGPLCIWPLFSSLNWDEEPFFGIAKLLGYRPTKTTKWKAVMPGRRGRVLLMLAAGTCLPTTRKFVGNSTRLEN